LTGLREKGWGPTKEQRRQAREFKVQDEARRRVEDDGFSVRHVRPPSR
jgi:hypothetical protein